MKQHPRKTFLAAADIKCSPRPVGFEFTLAVSIKTFLLNLVIIFGYYLLQRKEVLLYIF